MLNAFDRHGEQGEKNKFGQQQSILQKEHSKFRIIATN